MLPCWSVEIPDSRCAISWPTQEPDKNTTDSIDYVTTYIRLVLTMLKVIHEVIKKSTFSYLSCKRVAIHSSCLPHIKCAGAENIHSQLMEGDYKLWERGRPQWTKTLMENNLLTICKITGISSRVEWGSMGGGGGAWIFSAVIKSNVKSKRMHINYFVN